VVFIAEILLWWRNKQGEQQRKREKKLLAERRPEGAFGKHLCGSPETLRNKNRLPFVGADGFL
jgi:hypothetical protein